MVTLDTSRVGECEFLLMSELNCQLVIHQPYRALLTLQSELGLVKDDIDHAWVIISDHYMTDAPLLYAPHIIALAAITLALTPGLMDSSSMLSMMMTQAHMLARGSKSAQELAEKSLDREREQLAAASSRGQRFSEWLGNSDVDLEAIVECSQDMISFYECRERYNNSIVQEQINRFVKARGLDR